MLVDDDGWWFLWCLFAVVVVAVADVVQLLMLTC